MRSRGRIFGCIIVLICAVMLLFRASMPAVAVATELPDVTTFSLHNGMRVVVIPNHAVPAVNHMVWYQFGSADDPAGKSGLAHFMEHLMFKGTKDVPAGEFSKRITRLGGYDNAFTSYDYTGYFQAIAKEHLPMLMEMEADRMQHLTLSEKDVLTEQKVILEERQSRVDSSVGGSLREQVQAAMFLHHPYRIPIIGWEHEIESLTQKDVEAFYRQHYRPDNAVLIVSGDVAPDEVKALATKYYGAITAKGDAPARQWVQEPPRQAKTELALTHPLAQKRIWTRQYEAPSLVYGESQHAYALMLLSYVLGAEHNGRLYKALVEASKGNTALATSVDADYNPFSRGPTAFSLSVLPKEESSLEAVQAIVDAELLRIRTSGVSADELARAKRVAKAWTVYQYEGLQPFARYVGLALSIGLPLDYFDQYDAHIDAVTAAQIQAAATHVLRRDAYVGAVMSPKTDDASVQEGAP